jgi:hypothetical protein
VLNCKDHLVPIIECSPTLNRLYFTANINMQSPQSESPTSASFLSTSGLSRSSSISSAPLEEPHKALPIGAPISQLFQIRETPTAGRAVFATQDIPEDTLLLRSDDLALSVLLREYRKEVCAQCFAYDYGRDLDIRDKDVGFVFCSEACQTQWHSETGEVGIQAWTAVETLVKKRSKEDNELVEEGLPRPKSGEIAKAWESATAQADLIRVAREGEPKKQHHKALAKATQALINPDVMSFCVSGLLWHYTHPDEWAHVLALAADSTPYHSTDDLAAFTRTYLHLIAILPLPLLPLVTADDIFILSSRDSHNSFGIRSLEDEGSEFFGYGCWPAASYFNHSCAPNVEKQRKGRAWEFRAGKDIKAGEGLNITYLSGEERRLSRGKRMDRLKRNWGFECGCESCEITS